MFSAVPRILALSIAAFLTAAYAQEQPPPKAPPAPEAPGMPPRAAPTDYQAHAQAGAVTIAAEFLGHSIPTPDAVLTNEDYVAVEVGIFGAAGARLTLSLGDFGLHISGKKTPLKSESDVLVFKSLKNPALEPTSSEKKSKTSLGTGGQNDEGSTPAVFHLPIEVQHKMIQQVRQEWLPEGDRALPQAGLIFFAYRGKTEKLRGIQLIYQGPAGKTTLALQP